MGQRMRPSLAHGKDPLAWEPSNDSLPVKCRSGKYHTGNPRALFIASVFQNGLKIPCRTRLQVWTGCV